MLIQHVSVSSSMLSPPDSVVLNAQSPIYGQLKAKLSAIYEDIMFPLDAKVLLQNSRDFLRRVQRANRTARGVANFLQGQEAILQVNYPTNVASAPLYEQYRRPKGGYGSLISIVFRKPADAIQFYDSVDLCKGPGFGANFTLVVPYSQLAHPNELDWAESQGISKHIIRISVGLEEEMILISKLNHSLQMLRHSSEGPTSLP